MNIVVLDGHTLNPGDLSWEELEKLGTVTVFDRTPPEHILERIGESDIVLTNKTPLTKETLAGLSRLKYIGVLATGYNIVDVQAASAQGITVTNVPTYGTDSVAQFVFALMLEHCHQIGRHSDSVRAGGWAESPDFCYTLSRQISLAGKTLGIVGFGRIGKQVTRLAQAFGMRVLVAGREGRSSEMQDEAVERVSLEELLSASDFLSLHCPLTPETNGLINKRRIALMKKTAFLINTSRGGLLVEQDVADALNEMRIAGAALDVLTIEPPNSENPLLAAKNCNVTPHMAWAAWEARSRLMDIAVRNVAAFLQGEPVHIVSQISK